MCMGMNVHPQPPLRAVPGGAGAGHRLAVRGVSWVPRPPPSPAPGLSLSHCGFICISPGTGDVGHISVCLFAVRVFSVVKCLFRLRFS